MTTPPAPKFEVAVGDSKATFLGPSWETEFAQRSLRRINAANTTEEAIAQGVAEMVMVAHSIRRILIWTAVIVPLILATVAVILMVSASNADVGTLY